MTIMKQFYEQAENPELYGDTSKLKIVYNMPYILRIRRIEHGDKNVDGAYKINDKYHLHYCGYVGLYKTHPLHGKINDFGGVSLIEDEERSADLIYAHGGITFTGYMNEWGKDFYFIGFDTVHMNDVNTIGVAKLAEHSTNKYHTGKLMTHAKVKKAVIGLWKDLIEYQKEESPWHELVQILRNEEEE